MFLAKVLASRYGWPSEPRPPETPDPCSTSPLSRVLGMLLAAYSVQFVINGIAAVPGSLS